jgi:hypothetical protein
LMISAVAIMPISTAIIGQLSGAPLKGNKLHLKF